MMTNPGSSPELVQMELSKFQERLLGTLECADGPVTMGEIRAGTERNIHHSLQPNMEYLLRNGAVERLSQQTYILAGRDPGERWQRLGAIGPLIHDYLREERYPVWAFHVRRHVNTKLFEREKEHFINQGDLEHIGDGFFRATFIDHAVSKRKLRRVLESREPLLVKSLTEIRWKLDYMSRVGQAQKLSSVRYGYFRGLYRPSNAHI